MEEQQQQQQPNQHVRTLFDKMIETKETFNVFLCGPTGTGKKTLIQRFVEGYSLPENALYRLNGCMVQGKDVINASSQSSKRSSTNQHDGPSLMAFLKSRISDLQPEQKRIVVVSSVEDMSVETQHALKSLVERYSHMALFLMEGVNADKVEKSLLSHFTSINVYALTIAQSVTFLNTLVPTSIARDLLQTTAFHCNGDYRQLLCYSKVLNTLHDFDEETQRTKFFHIFQVPSDQVLWKALEMITRDDEELFTFVKTELKDKGYITLDIVSILTKMLIYGSHPGLSKEQCSEWLYSLTEAYCDYIEITDIYSLFTRLRDAKA